MSGGIGENVPSDQEGVIPRIVDDIFKEMNLVSIPTEFSLGVRTGNQMNLRFDLSKSIWSEFGTCWMKMERISRSTILGILYRFSL